MSPTTISRGEHILGLCQSSLKHPVRTVLDFGFGEGAAVIAFAKNGNRTFGYDISNKFNILAKRNLVELRLEAFITDDWLELGKAIGGSGVDLVIMSDVYEHLENPAAEILKIKTIMSSNGHLYIAVPNRWSLPLFVYADPHFGLPFINVLGERSLNFVARKIFRKKFGYHISGSISHAKLFRVLGNLGFKVNDLSHQYYMDKFENPLSIENTFFRRFASNKAYLNALVKSAFFRFFIAPYVVVMATKE